MTARMTTPVALETMRHGGTVSTAGERPMSGARLRLTRRGRIVLGAFATCGAAALLAGVASFAGTAAQASDVSVDPQQFHYVVAQPGGSLWELASELDPAADPRDLVAEIVQLNQLDGSGVQAGQPLAVPLRYSEAQAVLSADELYGTAS